MKKKILITGGTGFLGINLAKKFEEFNNNYNNNKNIKNTFLLLMILTYVSY